MEEMLQIREEYRLQQWCGIIQARQNSGLSVRAYCKENGLGERQYYWLKKLRETAVEAASAPLVRLEDEPSPTQDVLHIQYRGAELKLPGNIDAEAILVIIQALQKQ